MSIKGFGCCRDVRFFLVRIFFIRGSILLSKSFVVIIYINDVGEKTCNGRRIYDVGLLLFKHDWHKVMDPIDYTHLVSSISASTTFIPASMKISANSFSDTTGGSGNNCNPIFKNFHVIPFALQCNFSKLTVS